MPSKYDVLFESPPKSEGGKYASLFDETGEAESGVSPTPAPVAALPSQTPSPLVTPEQADVASTVDQPPQAQPSSLPSPPAEVAEPITRQSLREVLHNVIRAPGRALAGAGAVTGGLLTGDTGAIEEAYNPVVPKNLVEPETASDVLRGLAGTFMPPGVNVSKDEKTGLGGALQGLFDVAGGAVSGASNPENLAWFLVPGMAGKGAQRMLGGLFEGDFLLGAPDQWKALKEAPSVREKVKIAGEMALGAGLPAAALAHTFLPEKAPVSAVVEAALPKQEQVIQSSVEPPPLPVSEPPVPAAPETVVGRMTPEENAIDFAKIEQPHAKGVEAGMKLDPSTAAEVAAELKETGKEMLQAYRDKEYDKATELQGKSTYLAGKLEGVKREGPNYDEVVRLQKESAAPTTEETVQPELVTPTEPEAPPQRTFKQRPPSDSFGGDNTPVAAAIINDLGGILSKSGAKKGGKLAGNEDLWDGAGGLKHPTHNKIYSENGQMPDQAAQALYDQGLIPEPTADAMYDALRKESQSASARSQVTAEKAQAAEVQTGQRQEKAFNKAKVDITQPPVEVFDLGVGDHVTIGNEKFRVTDINPDTFDVTLEDGKKFGVQQVKGGDVIYGEHEPLEIARPTTEQPALVATTEPSVPKLRAGENQGDIFANQTEDLALVGEKGIDHGKRAEEAAAAEIARQEAAIEQEKLQKTFELGPPEETKEGVVPAEELTKLSTSPEEATKISPQALGITHPMPGFINSITDYFINNTPSQIWNSIKGSISATLGKTFAKTTLASKRAGELGARWVSAHIAAPYLADTFTSQVLGDSKVPPLKFGALLTEDNLRSVKREFGRKAEEAENRLTLAQEIDNQIEMLKEEDAPKKEIKKLEKERRRILSLTDEQAEAWREQESNVRTIIGAPRSPFVNEETYQTFRQDPGVQQALQRHRALWEELISPMYREAQLLEPDEPLPSRGAQTGARINLFNDVEGAGKDVVSASSTGNLQATMRRKSPFARAAQGTGDNYNINYEAIMANTYGRQLSIAAKNAFEKELVDSGNAVIGKPGEKPLLKDGEETVAFPLKRTVLVQAENGRMIPTAQNIYVRKSIAGEYRRGADVDLLKVPAILRGFNNIVNRTALAGLTDASVHVLNQATALMTRPGVVGGALSDSLLSLFGRADIPFTLAKILTKSLKDSKAQLSELAEIGALQQRHPTANPLGRLIQFTGDKTRLILDDTYKRLVKEGLVEDSETARREFVNQIGQYNKRAQGDLRRLARDSGFGPFATAGTTFNTLGLRTFLGAPGAPATSAMAAAALRANVYSKWVGAFVFAGVANYLLTKDKGGGMMGRPGVPIGRIDTGLNDENDRPLSIPFFDIIGLGRALRVTGARGFIESQRKGLSLQNSFDAAATDIWNTNISPFMGPAIRFAAVASSGKALPSINVPRTSRVVAPGESQTAENIKQAIIDANPIIKSLSLANEPGQGAMASIRQQIPRLTLQPSQSAEFMEKYPQIVRKAQAREYINDVIGRARKMGPNEQQEFVRESLSRLTPEDQKQARRTLKYSHIRY